MRLSRPTIIPTSTQFCKLSPRRLKGHEVVQGKDYTKEVIGCAIEVHRNLGPGLLESIYEKALFWELTQTGLRVEQQVPLHIQYKELNPI